MNKILFPTDLSDKSEAIENYLITHKNGTKEVVVLNVIDQRMLDAVAIYDKKNDFLSAVKSDRQEEIDKKIVPKLKDAGYQVKIIVKEGFPYKEILNTSEAEDVDVIIMNSHGKGHHQGHLIGSVSEKVCKTLKKPVFVFKE